MSASQFFFKSVCQLCSLRTPQTDCPPRAGAGIEFLLEHTGILLLTCFFSLLHHILSKFWFSWYFLFNPGTNAYGAKNHIETF